MDSKADLKIFNQLFIDYQERFIRFAYTYVEDMAIAEDFTSEAFIYYWENRHTLKDNSNIPAYILTVVKHKCLNYLQHVQVKEQTTEKLINLATWELNIRITTLKACDPEEAFSNEAMEIVRKTLEAMPVKTRKVFIMSRFEDKTYNEIASELNLTRKGVEFHISKTLKALRFKLKDYLPTYTSLFF